MARKFVSGVLAFAMVFGATAPVVFAEPVATEVVDQEANYLPSLEKDKVTMSKGDTVTIKINDIGTADVKSDVDTNAFSYTYIKASKTIVLTALKDVTADTKVKLEITPASGEYYGTTELTLTVKPVASTGTLNTSDVAKATTQYVGLSSSYNFYYEKDGKEVAPKNVTWKVTTSGNDTLDITKETVTTSKGEVVKVTIKGLKKTTDSTKPTVKFDIDGKIVELKDVVVKDPTSIAALTMKQDKKEIATNTGVATIVAQAYTIDEYGDLKASDNQDLIWSVNGKTTTIGTTVKDAKGNALYSTKQGASKGIVEFTAHQDGTYEIAAADQANTHKASVSVKATSTVKYSTNKLYIAKSKTDLNKAGQSANVKPGTTIDFGALNYATIDDNSDKHLMADLSGWTVKFEVDNTRYASIDSKTGKFTVLGENDPDIAAALKNGGSANVNVTVTYTKNGSATQTLTYAVKITKADATARKLTVTDGSTTATSEYTKDSTGKWSETPSTKSVNKILTVGVSTAFTAKVADEKALLILSVRA